MRVVVVAARPRCESHPFRHVPQAAIWRVLVTKLDDQLFQRLVAEELVERHRGIHDELQMPSASTKLRAPGLVPSRERFGMNLNCNASNLTELRRLAVPHLGKE